MGRDSYDSSASSNSKRSSANRNIFRLSSSRLTPNLIKRKPLPQLPSPATISTIISPTSNRYESSPHVQYSPPSVKSNGSRRSTISNGSANPVNLRYLNMAAQTVLPPRKSSMARPLHIDITTEDGAEVVPNSHAPPPPPMPRSPGIVLQNFFGWKTKEADAGPFHTSPNVSPRHERASKGPPMSLDIPKANAASFAVFGNTSNPELPTPPASSVLVEELEMELREISTELAQSIKREMELEEEVERLRSLTADSHTDAGRRTSDYFSDSGTSSRYGNNEDPAKVEELEKSRRKAELEKAQVKLDMTTRMAEVMKQRRLAEDRVILLEEHVQSQSRIISPAIADPDRVRHLEIMVEEMKRKLDEERRNKASMEELIGGMTHEIEQYKSERDKLKDEVVPQLESKLANLEYYPIDTVAEEEQRSSLIRPSLARSKSSARWAGNRSRSNSAAALPTGQRSRSGSTTNETRDQLIERAKDLEAQKDALHKALKQLLDRHRWQEKQYQHKIRMLEEEKLKAKTYNPRKVVFPNEVKSLRGEILELRKRADDALDQKWNTEKGLSSLKMDLDRAREETSSLRAILRSHDISIPSSPIRRPSAITLDGESQVKSLDKAYEELKTTHALSIAHLSNLGSPSAPEFNLQESNDILDLLKKSLSAAESERDSAHTAAEKYRLQARQLAKSEIHHLSKQADMSVELLAATNRMDELVGQVRSQLATNGDLRKRLASALERGEREQKVSEEQIRELQGKLKSLEDQLLSAQQASEEAIASHEDDIRRLREADNSQLQRSKLGPSSANSSGLAGLGSPLLFGIKSPKLELNGSGGPRTLPEVTGTIRLETRVKELEKALAEAESEMGEVVSRMNRAQMEVAELQGERDEAAMRSRRLQAEVVGEREKVRMLMQRQD